MKELPALPECDALLTRLYRKIAPESKLAFLAAFVSGMLTHLYMFTGKYPNQDEVLNLYSPNNANIFGRWLLHAATFFSSDSSVPLVNGIVSVLALSLAAVLVVRMLRITKRVQIVAVAVVMVSFPTVANNFAWMHCADGFLTGLFVAVAGAYVTDRYRRGWIAGLLLFLCSLAIYQAQICVAIALLATRYLQVLLEKRSTDKEALSLLLRDAAALLGSVVLYVLLARFVVPALGGTALSVHAGLDTMGSVSLSAVPGLFLDAYYQFAQYFLRTSMLVSWRYVRYLHMAIGALEGLFILLAAFRGGKKSALQLVFTLLILALLPALYGSIYLTGAETGPTYYLMIYSYVFVYILLIVAYNAYAAACEERPSKCPRVFPNLLGYVAVFLTLWIGLANAVNDNELYLALQLKYENSFALANRIVQSVEQCEGYTNETPVYIDGSLPHGNYPHSKEVVFKAFSRFSAMQGPSEYSLMYTDKSFHAFAQYYIGVLFETADAEQVSAALSSPAYREMTVYPRPGSVRCIEGVVVVKTS